MRLRAIVGAGALVCLLVSGPLRAQPQPEYGVLCAEGSAEPIPLSKGVHTYYANGCAIGPTGADVDTFTFLANEGDAIRLTVSSTRFVDPRVELRGPGGALVDEAQCVAPCSVRLALDLTQSGNYSVVVSDSGSDDTGAYLLQLELGYPRYCALQLRPGAPVADALDPRTDVDVLRFEGRTGDTMRLQLATTGTADLRLEILGPARTLIREETCAGPCTITADELLTESGTFHALVSEVEADETAEYSIAIQCLNGGCLGDTVVDDLLFTTDQQTLEWTPVADVDALFDLCRGQLSGLRAGGFTAGIERCLLAATLATSATESDQPSPGDGFYYVVRSVGQDGLVGAYDSRWAPSQVCGRSTTICEPDGGCQAATAVPGVPFSDTGNTCGAPAVVRDYSNTDTTNLCNPPPYPGPEVIYSLQLGSTNDLTLTLTPAASADLALFVVSDCTDPSSCVAWADEIGPGAVTQLSPGALPAGSYFVYVDSYYGDGPSSCGDFTLEVSGQLATAAPKLISFDVN